MPALIVNIWNRELNKELTKCASIGVDPRSSVSYVENKSWLWHSFSSHWRQNIEHGGETVGLASVKWCRSGRSLFISSHWAACYGLKWRQEKMGVIPPAFTSWLEEKDLKMSRDAGSWISLPDVAWSGRLATIWGISIRVVIWLWWVQKKLVKVVNPISIRTECDKHWMHWSHLHIARFGNPSRLGENHAPIILCTTSNWLGRWGDFS